MFITAMGNESKTRRVFTRGVIVISMCVLLLTSVFSVAALNKTAVINVDGQQIKVSTMTSDTDEILQGAGISIGNNDLVKTTTDDDGNVIINITRAFSVCIDNDGAKSEYMVTGGTVKDLLSKANITVTANHIVNPNMDTKLTSDLTVKICEYKTITVSADGNTTEEKVPNGTVGEALEYLNIELSKNDVVNYSLTDEVTDGMAVEVTRVSYREITTVEKIPFETVETYSDKLEEGKTQVKTKGVDGEITAVRQETLVDGEVVDTTYISYDITKEAVNEEVIIGTKEKSSNTTKSKTADKAKSDEDESDDNDTSSGIPTSEEDGVLYDESGNEVSYSAVYHGSGTAYYAPAGSLTASGQEVYVGGVAVNPNIIPLGTKLYIVADDGFVYGYATAIDTGGALYDGSAIVDVFYFTYEECVEFGRRDVSVYVLD